MAASSPEIIKFDSNFSSIHEGIRLILFQKTTLNTLTTMVTFLLSVAKVARCQA